MFRVVHQIVRLRQKLKEAQDAVKGAFGFAKETDAAAEKLDQIKVALPPSLRFVANYCFVQLCFPVSSDACGARVSSSYHEHVNC